MKFPRLGALVLATGLIMTLGCGGGPSLAEVTGTVKQNGKGLGKIQVEFLPEQPGPRSIGVTDESGKYTLKTDGGGAGALVGSHRVILRDIGLFGDKLMGRKGEGKDLSNGKRPRIPADMSDLAKSKLKKEVAGGKKNEIDIEVSAPSPEPE